MSITENIVTGRKYRRITSTDPNVWERISFWTMAGDVELDDGTDLQTKLDELETKAAGTANVAQVLNGYTFSSNYGVNLTGTMNNWGSNTVTMSSNTATLSAGYYSGITINAASRYTAGYNSATLTITSVGNISSSGANVTVNCKSVTGYASMTANNFAVCITNVTATAADTNINGASYPQFGSLSATGNVSKSYNASNGVLTVTGLGANSTYTNGDNTWQRKATATVTARVWCYYIA